MKVSGKAVRQQSQIISKLSKSAAIMAADNIIDGMEAEEVVDVAVRIATAYTEMSAALTANYYNSIRSASSVKSRYTAVMDSGYDPGKTAAAATAIFNEVSSGRATAPLSKLIGDVVGRDIKNAADHCIRWNCKRDPSKPRYAIVPTDDACAFCQMRAGLGYTYADEDAVESHDNCSCTATPVFNGATIQGYDPRVYESRYDQAAKAYRSGDISDDLKERIDRQRELKGKDFKSTNAILMVMREQQGIT
ncbi:MAG: hypothetical protein IKG22_05495 [Atopobiaceae bacterium]|nr:hypothetical protein [Atopobiaceae bacterium]